jgi:hypothetical protein
MESDVEKVLKYLERAQELVNLATSIKDVHAQQAIIQAAGQYQKMAAELGFKLQPEDKN